MSTLQEQLARLSRFRTAVQKGDPKLAEESNDLKTRTEGYQAPLPPEAVEAAIEVESIAMRRERPVLAICENVTQMDFIDQIESEIWSERLSRAKPLLDVAIPAVGRINLVGGSRDWIGTGWLVAENVLVTNRHIASEFVVRKGEGFDFAMGFSYPVAATTDFLQEIGNPRTLVFRLTKPLHVEGGSGPDIAFFEIERVSGDQKLSKPIPLATRIEPTSNVAVIGYPAYDSRIPEPDLMERIYGKVYNKKRLAPGGLIRLEETRVWHDCTTLGGNSGSVVLDLDSGIALGLHFSGSFLKANYAVRADVVRKLLDQVRSDRAGRRPSAPRDRVAPAQIEVSAMCPAQKTPKFAATFTIPLTVSVSFGSPQMTPVPATDRSPVAWSRYNNDAHIDDSEAMAADYDDRQGYVRDFLGDRFAVDLPIVRRAAGDVLIFETDDRGPQSELRYEHFSVVMSRSRRMCFFSACNINGGEARKRARVAWKWDPRVPRNQQIMKECYGSPPKFSRGHMTRREDPSWGSAVTAKRGNEDSMHVTNAVLQMQAFNAPIWLALEDYALEHAREDQMNISVFTGPYFAEDDPELYGVRIPVAFWKVIAFIHDDTGQLCATGYEMDQKGSLQPEEEFVFGTFNSPQLGTATQVPIHAIQTRSGLIFGTLADIDPMADEDESVSNGTRAPLLALEQIRFVR